MRYPLRRAVLVGVAAAYVLALVAATVFQVTVGVATVGLPTWARIGGRLPGTVPLGTLTTLPLPGALLAGWLTGDPSRGALAGFLAHLVAVALAAAALLVGFGLLGAATTLSTGGAPADALGVLTIAALLAVLATVGAAGVALGGAVAVGLGGAAGLVSAQAAERQ